MKIRNGFISNSSSSSFILSFKQFPKNVEEMTLLIYDNKREFKDFNDDDIFSLPINTEQLATTIYDQCLIKKEASNGELFDLIQELAYIDLKRELMPNYTDWTELDHDDDSVMIETWKRLQKFKEETKGWFTTILEFDDCKKPFEKNSILRNQTFQDLRKDGLKILEVRHD